MEANERIKHLVEMLEKEPFDSFLNYALATEFFKQGNSSEAIEMLEKILERNPDYLGAYLQLGQWYETVNKADKALAIYQKGCIVAQKQQNHKALSELNQAIFMLED